MTMRERMMAGKLFTDMCEGLQEEQRGKLLMKQFNDSRPDEPKKRAALMNEMFGKPCRVIREIGEQDQRYYYRDRVIDPEDLAEERRL